MPAFGNAANEFEKVPMINNGTLNPIPKTNSNPKPVSALPMVETILSRSANPGERQGDAMVPLAAPNKKADKTELSDSVFFLCKNAGIYMLYSPNIDSAK